jgi:hypothetical protein
VKAFNTIFVRREALLVRVGVKDHHRRAVAVVR